MFTASQKRKENIAEYMLYMWQIEDIIRANNLDIDKIQANVIDAYNLDEKSKKEMREWYESIIDMMRREDVEQSGHIQMNKNIMMRIVELHNALLANPQFNDYTAKYYNALPYIVELRAKAGENKSGEIETCFNALYGMLMLRLKKREISPETQNAITAISKMIATLAHYFNLDDNDKLFNKD